jgi:fructose-1,6-bisphosphatase/inositol monophosphatase family enzyme
VLDPIDGTKTFVRGVPLWGSLVGVMRGSEVVAGAASFPAAGELLSAARGLGAWVGDRRARVSEMSDLERATVLTTDETFSYVPARLASWRALAKEAGVVRSWGDCYGYLLVATGRAEAMLDPILSPWDAAPFVVILPEAGGVITDWDGGTDFTSAIATNAALAARVRAVLGGGR